MENMDKVNIVMIIAALSQYWRYNVYNKYLQNNSGTFHWSKSMCIFKFLI